MAHFFTMEKFEDLVDVQVAYFDHMAKHPLETYHTPLYDNTDVSSTSSHEHTPFSDEDTDSWSDFTLGSQTSEDEDESDTASSTRSRFSLSNRVLIGDILDGNDEDCDGYTVAPKEHAIGDKLLDLWRQRKTKPLQVEIETDKDLPFGRLQYVLGVEHVTHYEWLLDMARMPATRALSSCVLLDCIGAARSSPTCVRAAMLQVWVKTQDDARWCVDRLMHHTKIGVMATFANNMPLCNFAMHRLMAHSSACTNIANGTSMCVVGCQVADGVARATVSGPALTTVAEVVQTMKSVIPEYRDLGMTSVVFQWAGPWVVCDNAHLGVIQFCMETGAGMTIVTDATREAELAHTMKAVSDAACDVLLGREKTKLLKKHDVC